MKILGNKFTVEGEKDDYITQWIYRGEYESY